MVEGIELVSNLITRYAIFEKLYLRTATGLEAGAEGRDQLAQAILKLYTTVLKYLSNAKCYFSRHTSGVLMCSLIYAPDMTY